MPDGDRLSFLDIFRIQQDPSRAGDKTTYKLDLKEFHMGVTDYGSSTDHSSIRHQRDILYLEVNYLRIQFNEVESNLVILKDITR